MMMSMTRGEEHSREAPARLCTVFTVLCMLSDSEIRTCHVCAHARTCSISHAEQRHSNTVYLELTQYYHGPYRQRTNAILARPVFARCALNLAPPPAPLQPS